MSKRLIPWTYLSGLVMAAVLATPLPAVAQSGSHVAVGLEVTKRVFTEGAFQQQVSAGLLYRIRRHPEPSNGWKFRVPQFGFNWFSADVDMPVGGQDTGIGRLHVRPFLAGVGETLVFHDGKDELSFNILAGPAFASFKVSSLARDAYRQRLGADPVAIDAKNTIAVRPGVSYWHDLNDRLGFHAAISYVIARPEVVVRTPSGESTSRWHTDNVAFKAGVAVGVF